MCSFLFSNGKSPEIRNGAAKVVMAMVDKIGKDSDTTKEMLNSLQMSNKGLYGKVTKSRKKSNKLPTLQSATVVLVMAGVDVALLGRIPP